MRRRTIAVERNLTLAEAAWPPRLSFGGIHILADLRHNRNRLPDAVRLTPD